MWDVLKIENFKCFLKQRINIANLTVLVGSNGAGKSSVMQSMLLLRQLIDTPTMSEVQLNGPYGLALGTDGSINNQSFESYDTKMSLRSNNNVCSMQIKPIGDGNNLSAYINYRRVPRLKIGFFSDCFYFLSADRTGPRVSQTLASLPFVNTGLYGEHTAQVLADRYMKIDERRKHPNSESLFLLQQVNAWLDAILPGLTVKAEKDMQMQVAQVLIKNGVTEEFLTSTNIGFGISYALPIIVTGLVAKEGSYLLVENPEAHLHPAAQSAMGKFLAMLSSVGVRVVIETHSNHILDGIQIYASQHKLPLDSVIIHNFEIHSGKVRVSSIVYNEQYSYNNWPKGFMDQTSRDYLEYYNTIQKK